MTCCQIVECQKPVLARGWCSAHYRRWRVHGDPLGSSPRPRATCGVTDCGDPAEARNLCVKHLNRLNRTGTTDEYVPVMERFDLFVHQQGPDDCWEWLGPRNNWNYGRIGLLYAHRVACERAHGVPPSGAVAMHSCDNPPCVNPAHLSWGSISDNSQDMWDKGRHPRKKVSQ